MSSVQLKSSEPKLIMGVLELNFDTLVIAKEAAAAFIIKDHQGLLVRAGGKILPPSSIPSAEMVAAWMGVRVVIYGTGITELWVEGDSLTVIKWLTKNAWNNSSLHPLLRDLLSRKQILQDHSDISYFLCG